MRSFWVYWTYLGNYSKPMEVTAKNAADAAKAATCIFSQDFHDKGIVYVLDSPPVLVIKGSKVGL